MKKLIVLKTDKDNLIEESATLLKEAVEAKFESVLIIGIKGDKVRFKVSRSVDTMHKLGMIECAKLDWFSRWE